MCTIPVEGSVDQGFSACGAQSSSDSILRAYVRNANYREGEGRDKERERKGQVSLYLLVHSPNSHHCQSWAIAKGKQKEQLT